MKNYTTVRKLGVLVLVFLSLLTLAACKGADKTPYGSITDDTYVQFGNVSVTKKELYDQMRLQGASVLAAMIDETIFAEHIAAVKTLLANGDETTNQFLDETVNQAIHGTTDLEKLEEFYTKYPERFLRNIEKFADSLFLLDNSITIANVISQIESLPGKYEGYASIPAIVDNYTIRVTQRHYARSILETLAVDEDSEFFISEDDLVRYYNGNIKGQYDVEALIVRFINLNEANAALYRASIKSDARGVWYKIPDIRISDTNDPNYVDLTDLSQTGFGHVKKILDDLNINYQDRNQISILDFENYYKSYTISTTRTNGREDVPLTTSQVKQEFVNIYNLLNPQTQVEVASDGSIVAKAGSSFNATVTFEELTKINTTLRSHIYTTLVSEASMDDKEDITGGKPYSARIQTFGSSRYLVFRLSDQSETEEGILIENPEDPDKEIFASTPKAIEKRNEVFQEVFKSRLTDQFISIQVQELYNEKTIDIYDRIVRIFYDQSYGYSGTDKTRSGNVIATVDGKDILVDDFYQRLEKSFGINLSLDILLSKVLLSSETYTVSAEEKENYKKQFEDIISQFSADNFASAGYPASMGREKFLLTAFGARTNTEAINQVYIYPELRKQYIEDLEAHYHKTNDTIYQKLAEFAGKQYDEFKSINVSHLLIYVDTNFDGSPDDPQEFLDSLSAQARAEVLQGLTDLVKKIYQIVGEFKSHTEGLQAIAEEFNNSGRIEIGSRSKPIDYQIELDWARFRQLGFYLKFENLPNAITNQSNFVTGQAVLDPVFYTRAMQIHDQLALIEKDDAKFPHLDLYDSVITQAALEEVKSSFGWHLILATRVDEKRSAIFSSEDDLDGRYVSFDGTLNAYNEDSERLTASQIEFFLKGEKSDEGVVLPPDVQQAITQYLNPVLTRYRGTNMQRELVFMFLQSAQFVGAPNGANRLATVRQININQMNEYQLSSRPGAVYDENYAALFGQWFQILTR